MLVQHCCLRGLLQQQLCLPEKFLTTFQFLPYAACFFLCFMVGRNSLIQVLAADSPCCWGAFGTKECPHRLPPASVTCPADGARLGQGAGGRGSGHRPCCSASGAGMMAENIPACICSHLATACSPGCFSRRVWSVLAKESLLFPKRAYHFVLDNDGNFRHFFFHLETNRREPAFAGGIVLVFLRAESHRTDKVSPKCCCPCRCWTWEGWVGGGGELISALCTE